MISSGGRYLLFMLIFRFFDAELALRDELSRSCGAEFQLQCSLTQYVYLFIRLSC